MTDTLTINAKGNNEGVRIAVSDNHGNRFDASELQLTCGTDRYDAKIPAMKAIIPTLIEPLISDHSGSSTPKQPYPAETAKEFFSNPITKDAFREGARMMQGISSAVTGLRDAVKENVQEVESTTQITLAGQSPFIAACQNADKELGAYRLTAR